MKTWLINILAVSTLSGCIASNSSQPTSAVSPVINGTGGTINYCRPKSITRVAETVELYINGRQSTLDGQLAAKIKNGSTGSVAIGLNQNFTFGLKPSLLFMRSSDQIAFSNKATSRKDRYFLVKGKANHAQGVAVLLGGAIGAAALEDNQDTGKANWDVKGVTKSEFETSCK